MLRLSKKADYALIAVTDMAAPDRRPIVSARDLAERHALPLELLAKVLQRLARRGVLRSAQGMNGGYSLARRPAEISVAEVVEAIDGPLTLTACAEAVENCEQFDRCSIRDPLERIRSRIAAALSACSIAELAADQGPGPRAESLSLVRTPAPRLHGSELV